MKKSNIFIIVIVLAVVVVIGTVFALSSGPSSNDESLRQHREQAASQPEAKHAQKTVSYQGVEGKNALELLKQTHDVKAERYEGLGELVKSIDGVAADDKHFWALYVNDKQSQVGAGDYITKTNDKITWKFEPIQ